MDFRDSYLGCWGVGGKYDRSHERVLYAMLIGIEHCHFSIENMDYEIFDAGDVTLQSGRVFPSLRLAYKTYGTLNASRDNVIVFLTPFTAQHTDLEWLIRADGPFDPAQWFIVIPNMFGNGLSSSPSNVGPEVLLEDYPLITYHDAVEVQHRLVVGHLGVSRIALVYGWSMGGMQAYHWAVRFPDLMDRVAVVCGSARCSPFNHVFIEGVKAALTADIAYQDGKFIARPERGYRAMGRVYAGWALSPAFYRDEVWRDVGYTSLEGYIVDAWDMNFARRDGNDLLSQLATWQNGDVSGVVDFGGDFDRALGAIRADVLLMPCETDAYFRVEDSREEVLKLTGARSVELKVIPSPWGHRAGNPGAIPGEKEWLEEALGEFLFRGV